MTPRPGTSGRVMGRHSVLLLDEDEHLRIRRLLMPAFQGAPLYGYRELISELTRVEVDRWPTGTPLRLHDRMQSLTLEIILQVVFGVSAESRLARLRPVVDRVVGIKPVTMLGWFYPGLRRWWPWRSFAELRRGAGRARPERPKVRNITLAPSRGSRVRLSPRPE